jgi:outer membrane lipoprotein carrier protein
MKAFALLLSASILMMAGQIKIPSSFSAKFTQKITNPKKKSIHYSGTIRLNSDGALKWSYQKPTQKEVCSNGQAFTIVDHDLEQVSFHKLDRALDLASVLKRAKHHKDNLYIATYQGVLYTFSLDSHGRIDQIAYKDSLDNVVNIHFLNMRYSSKTNTQSSMQCPYPKAYDIIRG